MWMVFYITTALIAVFVSLRITSVLKRSKKPINFMKIVLQEANVSFFNTHTYNTIMHCGFILLHTSTALCELAIVICFCRTAKQGKGREMLSLLEVKVC